MTRKRARISRATIFFALLSLVLAILLYVETRPSRRAPRPAPAVIPRVSPSPRPAVHHPRHLTAAPGRPSPESALPAGTQVRIAILIDDLGNDFAAVDRITRWPYAISAAVLPGLPGSARTARELESSGKEVLLHLPMEPKGFPSVRPGPGVLLRAQSDEEIGQTLERDLESVPGAVGVNNHMGSAATADPRVMRVVMRVLADRGLFFVDSRTTDATVAETEARTAGVPAVSRRVFLDAVATGDGVTRALENLLAHGRQDGFAVGIGHPHAVTLSILEKELPRLRAEDVVLVKVGELVR